MKGRRPPPHRRAKPEFTVELHELAFGGDAVGRHLGQAVFVSGGVPGDRVRVRTQKRHASYVRAELVDVLVPGQGRRRPPCTIAGDCGGCQWQQLEYQGQVDCKEEILRRALRKLPVRSLTMVAAPHELGYRRRVRMQWIAAKSGLRLGFHRAGSHQLVDAPACPLLMDPLRRVVGALRIPLAACAGSRGSVSLLCGRDRRVVVSLRAERGPLPSPQQLLALGVRGGVIMDERGSTQLFGEQEVDLGDGLRARANGFAQANSQQELQLLRVVGTFVEGGPSHLALDLYAGNGNLTSVVARYAERVVAVELSDACASALRSNAESMEAPVQVLQLDAVEAVRQLNTEGMRPELVVLDPPREGARAVVRELVSLKPRRLIYVSCDPSTLARDLALFCERHSGTLDVVGLDMMPQTYHIEVVARWTGTAAPLVGSRLASP